MNKAYRPSVKCAVNNCGNKCTKSKMLVISLSLKMIQSVDDVVKKRYSVCGKHFETYMFLNDLKNRLQPHSSYLYYLMMRP
eukprot:XP_016664116.1 PREDICTED: uncharacterized protein LOC100572261 isoform X1 [Acyrthosiphon pisum]